MEVKVCSTEIDCGLAKTVKIILYLFRVVIETFSRSVCLYRQPLSPFMFAGLLPLRHIWNTNTK